MGYEIETVSDYPKRFPTEPDAPQREEDDTDEEYADMVQDYQEEMQEYYTERAELLSKSEAGEITLYMGWAQ